MRKFLLIIMTTLCITAISAQSLYGKRLENKADNSLVSQNVEETNISFPVNISLLRCIQNQIGKKS